MIKGKSKFDYDYFPEFYTNLIAFNKQRYTKEQAIALWHEELMCQNKEPYIIEEGFVRFGFGVDEDEECRNCWWHEWEDHGNKSVPVWSIRSPFHWEKEGISN